MRLRLIDLAPDFAAELRALLLSNGQDALAAQIDGLQVVDRCTCADEFCATFYSEPKPAGAYGPSHRNVEVSPAQGMLILDIVDERIACVEVLYNDDFRRRLLAALP